MVDIVALYQCLRPHVTATTLRQLSRITLALLAITGRIAMLGLSRWTSLERVMHLKVSTQRDV